MEPTWLARLTRRAELEQLLGPDLKGVPTVVFLDPSGSERRDLRLVEFLALAGFLQYMGTFQ